MERLAVEVDAHARELAARETSVERATQRREHVALLAAAEEADRVIGRAVDPEEGNPVADLVRRREQRAVAADRDDEVDAARDPAARPAAEHDVGAELVERAIDLAHRLLVRLVRRAEAHDRRIVTAEQTREERVVLLDDELAVGGPLLDDGDLHAISSARRRRASSVFSSRISPRRHAASASSSGMLDDPRAGLDGRAVALGLGARRRVDLDVEEVVHLADERGGGMRGRTEVGERALRDVEAELLGDLACRGGARALARLDEAGGDLPEHGRVVGLAARSASGGRRQLRNHTCTRPPST